MPRGENKEFRKRIGKLSMPLKRRNVEKKLESKDIPSDKFDVEAYLTEDESFSEIWESIEDQVNALEDKNFEDMTEAEVINEIEKYKSIAEGYEEDVFDGA